MDEEPCAFAREIAESAAKYSYDKELLTKKALGALPAFLAKWWEKWKPNIRTEAAKGIQVFTTTVQLPPTIYACKPTNDQIRAALPDEITKGFGAEPGKIDAHHVYFDITISVASLRSAALKRMREEGEKDTDAQEKKSRGDQDVEEEEADSVSTTAVKEEEVE